MLVLTILSVKDALTTGISSGRLPALAENISIDDAKVKRDLLRDSCKPPAISVQETYHFLLRLMKRERERERMNIKDHSRILELLDKPAVSTWSTFVLACWGPHSTQ